MEEMSNTSGMVGDVPFQNTSGAIDCNDDMNSIKTSKQKLCFNQLKNDNRLQNNIFHQTDTPPDGGWGWMVTFGAFLTSFILDGISSSFGVLFKEIMIFYKTNKSLTSWITSAFNGSYHLIGPVASIFSDKYGCRKVAMFGAFISAVSFFLCSWSPNIQVLIVLYGVLGGCGLGFIYNPSLVMVGSYFREKRAFATGIAVCGSGIGSFIFAPLCTYLTEMYTWKGTMWIIAAITLNGVPIGALFRPLDNSTTGRETDRTHTCGNPADTETGNKCSDLDNNENNSSISQTFSFELLRRSSFLVYCLSNFLCMLGFFVPFTFLPDLANDLGMTPQQGALLIAITGIFNTIARVVCGWIADKAWADAILIYGGAIAIGGVATLFVPMYSEYGVLAIYCAVFGVSIAAFASLCTILVTELVGIDKLLSSFGLVAMFQGIAAFVGAPIAGALSDMSGNYTEVFYFAGVALTLSGVICFPLRRIKQCETSMQKK